MWLDCRNVGVSPEEFHRRLIEEGGVALNPGTDYGEQGKGFFRFNIATNRARVSDALERIEKTVRGLQK